MFGRLSGKLRIELMRYIDEQIGEHTASCLDLHRRHSHDFVSCETCGCLLWRDDGVKGVSEIRERSRTTISYGMPFWDSEKYIYEPYYCKVHAPVGKPAKKAS